MRHNEKKIIIIASFLMLYSCNTLDVGDWLESYRPRDFISEKIILDCNDTISIHSNLREVYMNLHEPYDSTDEKYTTYRIGFFQKNTVQHEIELVSVQVSKGDEPINFSVFYKSYPGLEDPQMIDTLPSVTKSKRFDYIVKIKEKQENLDKLTIQYQVNINSKPFIWKHQYRTRRVIGIKDYEIFGYWVRARK